MTNHPNIISSIRTPNVRFELELDELDSSTELIIVEKGSFAYAYPILNISRFTNLKSLIIEDECFQKTHKIIAVGLPNLEVIKIGMYCFWERSSGGYSFSVKNCSRLREIKIAPYSFRSWDKIEIEDAPSLEVIEIGYMQYNDEFDSGFSDASLELKSEYKEG